jgi:hypothetical protein
MTSESEMILQALNTADGKRLKHRQLTQKLRNWGFPFNYYKRAAALFELETEGRIRREMDGRDSRGFRTEVLVLIQL